MLHEFGDTAGKPELRSLLRALVVQGDLQSLVQEGQLAQPLCERVEAVGGLFKDAGIGVERNFRPGLARFAGLLQLGSGLALLVALLPHRTLARDFQLQPIGKRVDHGNAHAVQAAGNFVRFAVEFPGGLHGVGVSVVNALSDWLELEISRDGAVWEQTYEKGKPTNKLKQTGKTRKTGTKVTFHPDPTIFDKTVYSYDTL